MEARTSHRDDPDIAYNYFNRAITADPRFPTPHWQMGDLLRSEAQWLRGEEKKSERVRLARLALVVSLRQVLKNGLRLLGVSAPVKM